MRGSVTQTFSGAVIESVDDLLDIDVAEIQEAHLLGEELAQQPIGVLVSATLPRVIGPGEEHLGIQAKSH